MWLRTLNIVALAAQAVSAATIYESLQTVNNATAALGESAQSWKGDFFGTLPIIGASTVLLGDINDGTKDAKASATLTLDETFEVAGVTITLTGTVNSTLQTIIDRKPQFQKLLLTPIILGTLEIQKSATEKYTTAIVEKVPSEAQAIAQSLVAEIMASFQTALDAYQLF